MALGNFLPNVVFPILNVGCRSLSKGNCKQIQVNRLGNYVKWKQLQVARDMNYFYRTARMEWFQAITMNWPRNSGLRDHLKQFLRALSSRNIRNKIQSESNFSHRPRRSKQQEEVDLGVPVQRQAQCSTSLSKLCFV